MKIIPFVEILTCLTSITFFGAALYIHLVEHPARMACSPSVALAEWAPSYKRATLMQGFLATVNFLLAISVASLLSDIRWIWGE